MIDYRFKLRDLPRILNCLGPKDFTLDNGTVCKAKEALLMALYRFSFPRRLFDMEVKFGGELSRISRMITYVMKFVFRHHSFRVQNGLKLWAP